MVEVPVSKSARRGVGSVPTPRRQGLRQRKEFLWALAFLLPAGVAIITMRIAPALDAFWTSLHRGFPGGLKDPQFAGFENYLALFSSPAFGETVLRTIVFNVILNPAQILIALMLAVLMTRRLPLQGFWRILLFIPATIPIVGSSIVWGVGMRPDGPLNAIIEALGFGKQPFLTSPSHALASIMIVATWVGVGYWMLFLISGIEAIPDEYYEAARLDRAGPIRTFFHITLPMLKRPLLFVLVADTVANFVLFVPVQMLTGGGPENSTTMLMFDAYRTTYTYSDKNLGAAQVIILTLIMLAFVAAQFALLREEKENRNA